MDLHNLPKLIDGKQVAEIVGCSYVQALRIMRKIGAVKINKLVRVDRDEFVKYLDSRKQPTSNDESPTLRTLEDDSPTLRTLETNFEKSFDGWVLSLDGRRILVDCECDNQGKCDWCIATNNRPK